MREWDEEKKGNRRVWLEETARRARFARMYLCIGILF